MATHSSVLAWRIPWTEEPGGLQSVGLQRVGHNERLSTTSTAQDFIRSFSSSPVRRNNVCGDKALFFCSYQT